MPEKSDLPQGMIYIYIILKQWPLAGLRALPVRRGAMSIGIA
jgi:hypothetical protein